jgi:5'-nucleotidase
MLRPWKQGTFYNVNLPHLDPGSAIPEAVECRVDPSPLPLDWREEGDVLHYQGNYHERRREPGSDVDVCFQGRIAVTLISLF